MSTYKAVVDHLSPGEETKIVQNDGNLSTYKSAEYLIPHESI